MIDTKLILDTLCAVCSVNSAKSYKYDLRYYAEWCNTTDQSAIETLLSDYSLAQRQIQQYKNHLIQSKRAPATINRRLSTIRKICHIAKQLGFIDWKLDIDSVKIQSYRNTLGPSINAIRKILDTCSIDSPLNRRDNAIIHLLFDLGLRRNEICELTMADINFPRIKVIGKGQQTTYLTLPQTTLIALNHWLICRKSVNGPVFYRLDRDCELQPLNGSSIYRMVVNRANQAGISTTPHSLRHSAITYALDTGCDIRSVSRFARHKNITTTIIYDDNRQDLAGNVANNITERYQEESENGEENS